MRSNKKGRNSRRTQKRTKTKKSRRKVMRGGNGASTMKDCKYVSSRGILFSCDVYPKDPKSSITVISDIDLSSIQLGQTVYIQGSAVKDFSTKLATIPNKFILVSGDCDESIPEAIFTDAEFKAFIESDKIIHWFSQNCVGNHPKLSLIPIGLDYHTRVSSDIWGPIMSPQEQEAEIISVKNGAKPFYEREIKAYANFHFNMQADRKYTADRRDAKENIPPECVSYEPTFTKTRLETFQHQAKYAFVVSPHGNGLDCHRTWESLVLGCIPIIKTSAIDSLFSDLPVLIVNNWAEVTQQKLQETVAKFRNTEFNYEKLNLKYWMDLIGSKNQAGGQAQNIFHFFNKYHYGDNILNLKFFRVNAKVLKDRNIQIHYYYDNNYVKNKDELERYLDPSISPPVVVLHPLTEKPPNAIELWMGNKIEDPLVAKIGDWSPDYLNKDVHYRKFYKKILTHLGLQDIPIDTSMYQKEEYLLDAYNNLDAKYKDVDVLILNSPPASNQFNFDKQKMDALADRLSKKYKVVVIEPVNNITCTRDNGLKLQDIGAISTHAKYIFGMDSGPLTPCFNSYTRDSVKRWIIFDKIDTKFTEIQTVMLSNTEDIDTADKYVEIK